MQNAPAIAARVVRFKKFSGVLSTWDHLFEEVAAFATSLGPDRIISISHHTNTVVWYWEEVKPAEGGR